MNLTCRQESVARISQACISAIIRTDDQSTAARAIEAAVNGGFRMVEFTLTTPGAMELIAAFSRNADLLVGAGTVLTTDAARAAVQAGARFIVSPVCDAEVLAEAARLDAATIPGAFTPTEMQAAHRAGADFVKLFPAAPGGVDYVRAIRAPLPHLRLFPTAGCDADNFTQYLDAGCAGVGFVRSLFDPADLAATRYSAIRDRAALIVSRFEAWREKSDRVRPIA
jgi:2-dehydro-3-deoxyphosphogluconate aldolase/(4S)-4-hydroxy-2-oxoglutarate aldolase